MTKAEQTRLVSWRFKMLQQAAEGSRNVARTCRHFGLSRKTFYKWKQRYEVHGAAGLGDRASTPHRSPRATPREVVSKVLYLREHYHFGPGKIADYLKRFHGVSLATSSVHQAWDAPASCQSEVSVPPAPLETLRKAAARPPPPKWTSSSWSASRGRRNGSINSRPLTIVRASG